MHGMMEKEEDRWSDLGERDGSWRMRQWSRSCCRLRSVGACCSVCASHNPDGQGRHVGCRDGGGGQERTGCEAKLSAAHLGARHTQTGLRKWQERWGVPSFSLFFQLASVAQSSGSLGRAIRCPIIRWRRLQAIDVVIFAAQTC